MRSFLLCFSVGFAADCPGQPEGGDVVEPFVSHYTTLFAAVRSLPQAADVIITSVNNMKIRAAMATARCTVDYDSLLSALSRARSRILQQHHVHVRTYNKLLDEKADEANAVSKQLAAVSAMCAARSMPSPLLLWDVGAMDALSDAAAASVAFLCVPVCALLQAALIAVGDVWCDAIDDTRSVVCGLGLSKFIRGTGGLSRNRLAVYPRVSSGALGEYVSPEDACLMLRDDAGAMVDAHVVVERAADGGLQLSYAVGVDCAHVLQLRLTVCGVAIGSPFTVTCGYNAIAGDRVIASHHLGFHSSICGMCVSEDGRHSAISFPDKHEVRVFQLLPVFRQLRVIDQHSVIQRDPADFRYPARLCFTCDDVLVVCVWDSDCVQQFALTGQLLSSFHVIRPHAVAVHGSLAAVSTTNAFIVVHSLQTGECIRQFGGAGSDASQIGYCASAIRFTPDGTHILALEYSNPRMSLFTTEGEFMKHISCDVLRLRNSGDLTFSDAGEIVVTDREHDRICVFAPDGTLVRTWGFRGVENGSFVEPQSVAVAGAYLYVLDNMRLQVFE